MNSDDLYIVHRNIFSFNYNDQIDIGLLLFYTSDNHIINESKLSHVSSLVNYIAKRIVWVIMI